MKVLVACEFSGAVREAFRGCGHDAWSCDLLPAEDDSPHHLQCDVFDILEQDWDAMLFFYPCTNMCVSGARWFQFKQKQQARDVENFRRLSECSIPMTAGENPVGVLSTLYRPPDQIIHPWQFGHGETKTTCLWLKGLPPLRPTQFVEGRVPRVHWASPGPDRWKERSRTLPGIAEAMAQQWGALTEPIRTFTQTNLPLFTSLP